MAIVDLCKLRSRAGRKRLEKLLSRGDDLLDPRLLEKTGKILDKIRRGGDRELLRAAAKYDGSDATTAAGLLLPVEPVDERLLAPGFVEAFERALAAVERYHEAQRHPGFTLVSEGVTLAERRLPLRRVGIYVPGGRASYPSTALMTVVPARLAGVAEIVVATPPRSWQNSPGLRYALHRLGVTEVWGLGGAQAVAAFAYGTATLLRVDKIAGPGNAWVTAAKFLVSQHVAIDSLAGPSEVLIVAGGDGSRRSPLAPGIAADLLAQAEHDPQATAVLITADEKLAKAVEKELRLQLRDLPTAAVARESLAANGALLVVDDLEEALELAERIAPEHLQLVGAAEALADRVRNAGAIFAGASSPEVFGDYLAGPSHVLPTAGTARFASGLSVEDFVRRSHLIRYSPEAAARVAEAAAILAETEGLPAHARAARLRLRGGE
jgi:histidinol dehydrogenase